MKRRVLFALLLMAASLDAEPRWIRRLTAVSACAASMADYVTTQRALAAGAIEMNPVLAGRQGAGLSLKAGLCALGLAAGETRTFGLLPQRASDRFWTTLAGAETLTFGLTARHNQELANGS